MIQKFRKKETIPERLNPGDREPEECSPGSIEQELDMCETGSLRGDEILHNHGIDEKAYTGDPGALDEIIDTNWNMDMAEEDREGDEHSSGLERGESERSHPPHIDTAMPGDRLILEEFEAQILQFPSRASRVLRKDIKKP